MYDSLHGVGWAALAFTIREKFNTCTIKADDSLSIGGLERSEDNIPTSSSISRTRESVYLGLLLVKDLPWVQMGWG